MAAIAEKEVIARLKRVPLFANLSTKHLKTIVKLGKEIKWPEGEAGVVEGSRAHAFYLILEGGVEVSREGKAVARLREDDFFGESAMITGGTRNATVTATTDSTFFVMSRTGFAGAVKANPDLALQLMSAMVARQPAGASSY